MILLKEEDSEGMKVQEGVQDPDGMKSTGGSAGSRRDEEYR